ncbi:MAG: hypothetical protein U0269_12370 [Polyangiales bacterium]
MNRTRTLDALLPLLFSFAASGCVGWAGTYQGRTTETWSSATGIDLTAENNPSSYEVDIDVAELPNDRLQIRLREVNNEYLCEVRGRKQGNNFTLDPNQTCSGRGAAASYTFTFLGGSGQLSTTQRRDYVGTQITQSCRNGVCRTATRDISHTTTTAWVNLSFSARITGRYDPTEEQPEPQPYSAEVRYEFVGSRGAN